MLFALKKPQANSAAKAVGKKTRNAVAAFSGANGLAQRYSTNPATAAKNHSQSSASNHACAINSGGKRRLNASSDKPSPATNTAAVSQRRRVSPHKKRSERANTHSNNCKTASTNTANNQRGIKTPSKMGAHHKPTETPMNFTAPAAPGATQEPRPETRGFTYNHTMLRVKDPAKSLDFYTRILGMTLLRKSDYEGGKFSLYFLAMLRGDENIPEDEEARRAWIARQSGILELTHNWGTETDPAFHYHNGNSEPRGFGHICISVPDFDAAIRWFDQNNVPYQKRPEDGTMRHIAFIKDPDDYWVEIIKG